MGEMGKKRSKLEVRNGRLEVSLPGKLLHCIELQPQGHGNRVFDNVSCDLSGSVEKIRENTNCFFTRAK